MSIEIGGLSRSLQKVGKVVAIVAGLTFGHAQAQTANGQRDVVVNDATRSGNTSGDLEALVNSVEYLSAFGLDTPLERRESALYFSGAGNNTPVTGVIPRELPPEALAATRTPSGRLFTPAQLTVQECSNLNTTNPDNPHLIQRTRAQLGLTAAQLRGRGNVRNLSGNMVFRNRVQDQRYTVITPSTPSKEIQVALDCASQEVRTRNGRDIEGGVVYFEPGEYFTDELFLRSNLRVVVDPGATFYLRETINTDGSIRRGRNLFNIGRNILRAQQWLGVNPTTFAKVENVEIAVAGGPNERFTVNLQGSCTDRINDPDDSSNTLINIPDRDFNVTAIPFLVGFAENFAVSGARIIDNYTISPSVFLVTDTDGQIGNRSWRGEFYPNPFQDRGPRRGVVQHIDAEGYRLTTLHCNSLQDKMFMSITCQLKTVLQFASSPVEAKTRSIKLAPISEQFET